MEEMVLDGVTLLSDYPEATSLFTSEVATTRSKHGIVDDATGVIFSPMLKDIYTTEIFKS